MAIQRSTKTAIPAFSNLHNYFRMHSKAYYKWHTKSFSPIVHLIVLAAYIVAIPLIGRDTFTTPKLYAEEPVTTIEADGKTTTTMAVYEDGGDGVDLAKETLTSVFPDLGSAVAAINLDLDSKDNAVEDTEIVRHVITVASDNVGETAYSLDSGVLIKTKYEPKPNPEAGVGAGAKQTITINNPTDGKITTDVNVDHSITASSFTWDGYEYKEIDKPLTLTPYEEAGATNPRDKEYRRAFEAANGEETDPATQSVTKGLTLDFMTKGQDGKDAIFSYDATDLKNYKPTFIVKKVDGQFKLTVHLPSVSVEPKSELVLDPTYDISTVPNNFSAKFLFPGASGNIPASQVAADVNGDGRQDLIIGSESVDSNSRANSGSVYVIYSTLLDSITGTGNYINLSTSSNYNLRFDGHAAGMGLGAGDIIYTDLTGDGRKDLAIGAANTDFNSRTNSGSLYVISNTIFSSATGTGNNYDLNSSSNYTYRLDGPTTSGFVGQWQVAGDINRNGKDDLAFQTWWTSNRGSVYIVNDSLLATFSGNINMATSTNYTVNLTGAATGDGLGGSGLLLTDINADGRLDLAAGTEQTDYNSRSNSGSLYFFYNSLIGEYATTGNTRDMGTSTNYNVRFDGPVAGSCLTCTFQDISFSIGDLDGDSRPDLGLSAFGATAGEVSNETGMTYIVYSPIFRDLAGTGNTIDMASSSKWNVRLVGSSGNFIERWGYAGQRIYDFNQDGANDLIAATHWGSTDFGNADIVYNAKLGSSASANVVVSMSAADSAAVRYQGGDDGVLISDYLLFYSGLEYGDLSNTGGNDMIFYGENYAGYGGPHEVVWLRNFPHTVTVNSLASSVTSATNAVTGTISASNSMTAVSSVQARVDSSSPTGTWTTCTANDGTFNSTSEQFSCSVDLGSTGSHTVYVRAVDANGVNTAVSRYGSTSTNYSVASSSTVSPTPTPTAETATDATAVTAANDTTAPTVALTRLGGALFRATTKSFTYTGRRPQLVGTGESGANVTVMADDKSVCTATISNGEWTCRATEALAPKDYQVIIFAIDGAGNKTTLPTFTLKVTESVSPDPEETAVDVASPIVPVTPVAVNDVAGANAYDTAISKNAAGAMVLSVFRVKVTSLFGQPMRHTKVMLRSEPQTVTTDGEGIAIFTNVTVGDHRLTLTMPGNITMSRLLSITEPSAAIAADASSPLTVSVQPVTVSFPYEVIYLVSLILLALIGRYGYTGWRKYSSSKHRS